MLHLLIAMWKEMLIGRIMDSKTKTLGIAYQQIACHGVTASDKWKAIKRCC